MKKRLLTLMSVFAVSALVAACSGGNTASSEGGSDSQAASSEVQSSEGGEQVQGSDTFTYIIDGDLGNTLNPLTADDRYSLMTCHAAYAPAYHIYGDGTVELKAWSLQKTVSAIP